MLLLSEEGECSKQVHAQPERKRQPARKKGEAGGAGDKELELKQKQDNREPTQDGSSSSNNNSSLIAPSSIALCAGFREKFGLKVQLKQF